MNLRNNELKDFILLLERLEDGSPQSSIIEIDAEFIAELTWWQKHLLDEGSTTLHSNPKVNRIDLQSYVIFLYRTEEKSQKNELINVQSLGWWLKNTPIRKREKDSEFYYEQPSYRARRLDLINKEINKQKKKEKKLARILASQSWWFSDDVQGMETEVEDFYMPEIDMPLITAALESDHARLYLLDHLLMLANLKQEPKELNPTVVSNTNFTSNSEFWNVILQGGRVSKPVILSGFQISDWFPRAPGVYHTKVAAEYRAHSSHHLIQGGEEPFFESRGKWLMMKGGIGTVRFKSVRLPIASEEEHWLCTSTSDRFVHTGIPLAIPDHLMQDVDFHTVYTIAGQVQFLPDSLESQFSHLTKVPHIYLLVDKIMPADQKKDLPFITPIVFFSSEWEVVQDQRLAGFTAFVTCHPSPVSELDRAGKWLKEYAELYQGRIITNFDQQRPLFEDVPFSLQNIASKNIDQQLLLSLNIENVVQLGNIIIHGNVGPGAAIGHGASVEGRNIAGRDIHDSDVS